MRVCLYTETALPKTGGQELVVDALARQYQSLGHEVVVLAPHPRLPLRPRDDLLPYPVVRHPRFYSTRWLVGWYRWWLLRLARGSGFDVLHCHGLYPPGYLAALCRARLGLPTVLTSHGGDVYEQNVRLARPVIRQRVAQGLAAADALVAISQFTRDGFARLCPQARRVVDIPNGVDLDSFFPPAPRPAELDPAVRPRDYLLFLGRLKHRKGADLLLEALARTAPAEGVQLVIAGDGEERLALERAAGERGLRGRVRFVGKVVGPAKAYLLQNALATVIPSRSWEAFPLVVLESYAAGTPVIATRIPGLADLVWPGATGWLVAPDDPGALAAGLRQLLDDRAASRRLGEQARAAAQDYGWPSIARRHLALYQQLLAERSRGRVA